MFKMIHPPCDISTSLTGNQRVFSYHFKLYFSIYFLYGITLPQKTERVFGYYLFICIVL